MDTRNRAMVVGVYLLGVVVLVAVAFGYYSYRRSIAERSLISDVKLNAEIESRLGRRVPAPQYVTTFNKASQSQRDLQSSLTMTRDVLEKRTLALNQKNAECKALKAELEESFMMILSLLAEESTSKPADSDSAKQAKAKLDSEVARLKEALAKSELLDAEQERQLAQLQSDLMQTDLELAAIQQQSKRELDVLLSEKEVLESTASDLAAHCGVIAVPPLIHLLTDERVEVRRWAAKTLGAIGPEAQEADVALHLLLSDPDKTVRTQAERALKAIAGDGIN